MSRKELQSDTNMNLLRSLVRIVPGDFTVNPPLLSLLAANIITIILAILENWDLATILFIYWAQSVIIGIFTVFTLFFADTAALAANMGWYSMVFCSYNLIAPVITEGKKIMLVSTIPMITTVITSKYSPFGEGYLKKQSGTAWPDIFQSQPPSSMPPWQHFSLAVQFS